MRETTTGGRATPPCQRSRRCAYLLALSLVLLTSAIGATLLHVVVTPRVVA